jgi:asparagine synthase (glutamine-hydrolysing)
MCGVAGALVFSGSAFEIDARYLVRMRDALEHRGPDGAGEWVSPDRRVGLAHRRLSIVDLTDAAAQPMANEDGSILVSFNGEIYNHAALRTELEATGKHRWKTDHSDTEVIIHAFEEWGIECLSRFRGMFAMAIWDGRQRELWLVRDRIGVKPLYYSVHHGRITFASEIKALLNDPEQPRALNEEALYHYLSFLVAPAPMTLFRGISKLPPGTWLKVTENGHIQSHRYWDVWDHTQPLTGVDEEEVEARILEELRTVQLRKVSDVPVGVFLSGGIDSSTNARLFSEGEGGPVKTFAIGYEGEHQTYQNELSYARMMAATVGADHHERLVTEQDLLDFLPEMVRLQDEPIGDPVCVPVYYVSKLAREHGVVVCQVGEGADELFCGYPAWQKALMLQRLSDLPLSRPLKGAGMLGLQLMDKDQGFPYEWLRRGYDGRPVFWSGAEVFTETHKRRLLSPRLQRQLDGASSWDVMRPVWERFKDRAWEQTNLHWMTYSDLMLRLPELLLMRIDKMSMGVSLEGRVPFLDYKFVELALSIPTALKTKGREPKYLLKRAVRDLLPPEIITRRKQGFGVPVREWMFGPGGKLGDLTRRELQDFARNTDVLDENEVAGVLASGNDRQGWLLLNLALWWKQYLA